MIRMRTLSQAINHLHSEDPDCAITIWHLRGLVKSGVLPHHMAGKKVLINLETLEKYLENPTSRASTYDSYKKVGRL